MPEATPKSGTGSEAKWEARPRESPMSDAQKAAVGAATEQTLEKGLLDQIVDEGRLARDPAARERGKNLVKEFVAQVLDGSMTIAKDAEAMINARIAQID